jgi:hypothetical protein
MFKLTGSIKMINATVQVSDRFSKREFVVSDTSSQYPQDILFQSTQDKCSLLDQFQVSDQIEVSFNLRGREWTSPQGEIKYFNTLEAWRIEKVGQGMPAGGPSAISLDPSDFPAESGKKAATSTNEEDDDLPF